VLATHPHDASSDEALVALINQGDGDAFEALYRRHRDWVMALAFRMVGDHHLALDVLQETFLYVLRKFPGFQLTCQFRSFLYPAVRNLSIAARQKAARVQGGSGQEQELEQLEAGPGTSGQTSSRDELGEAVASLPEAQREVLMLRFVDGLALGEIAEALGIPTGTVKSRLHHGLASLREDERARKFFLE